LDEGLTTFDVKNQVISESPSAVFLVASIVRLISSIFSLSFLSVSLRFRTSSRISMSVSSPSLAVLRSWRTKATRKVTNTTTAIVMTRNKNWFRVSDMVTK